MSKRTAGTDAEEEASKAEAEARILAEQVAELRRELKALAEQVGRVGRAGVGEFRARAQARAAERLEAGTAMADEVRDEIRELNEQVVAATRERPWRSLGYAAMAGVVLGLLMRR